MVNRAAVEDRLLARVRERRGGTSVPRRDRSSTARLSFGQLRLWLLDRLAPNSPEYVIPCAFRIQGPLDVGALESAFHGVALRHEVLRTRFELVDDVPAQIIDADPRVRVNLVVVDGSGEPDAAERERVALAAVEQEAVLGYDLAVEHPMRVTVVRLADDAHLLLVSIHHIAADGWSIQVLTRELRALYDAVLTGRPADLPEPVLQYADYAAWQRGWLSGDVLERQLGYWRERLGDAEPLDLPADRLRSRERSWAGAAVAFSVPTALTRQLVDLATRRSCSLYTVTLATFQIVLSRWSGQDDVTVGSPIAGRTRAEFEDLIGFFVNTLVLRTDTSGDPTFDELLGRVRETAHGAYAHQDLPFERLVEDLARERDLARNPLVQISFVFQDFEDSDWGLPGVTVEPVDIAVTTSKSDLQVTLAERADGGLHGEVMFSTDLFDEATAGRLAGHYLRVLEQVAANPGQRIGRIDLLTAAERDEVLRASNVVPAQRRSGTIHQLVAARRSRTPDATALVHRDQRLTYAQLDDRADQLAAQLRRQGAIRGARVGVCTERSVELVVALLGVLKAGAAFVPLDPGYPAERLRFIVEDAEIHVVLTHAPARHRVPVGAAVVLDLDEPASGPPLEQVAIPGDSGDPDDIAYVIYTSGSTGTPKGVPCTHRGVVNNLLAGQEMFPLTPADRVLQKTPFSFDVSVWEVFWPLLAGGQLIIAEPGGHRDPTYLREVLLAQRITVVHFVPSMLREFVDTVDLTEFTELRQVFCGGEALPTDLSRRFLAAKPSCLLHNLYGPTEASIHVSHWVCGLDDPGPVVPIGRPIANTQLLVVDRAGQLAPTGVPGELWIGGAGVAPGYLNRPELTTERFTAHPLSAEPSARAFRSGDLVRRRPDGAIEYIGRIDRQVKLRGLRIELGEVESVLDRHEDVASSVVVVREDERGDRRLVAYCVPVPGRPLSPAALRRWCRRGLPDYMTPSWFVSLDELPLTRNGKVDHRALPEPVGAHLDREHVPPRTEVERIVAGVWVDVLGQERVGIHDNFFDLGGHSLLATRLVNRIRAVVGVELPLKAVFEAPTVAGLVPRLATAYPVQVPIRATTRPDRIPLSFQQRQMWFLSELDGGTAYNIPSAHRLSGEVDVPALRDALADLVERHEVLRTVFRAEAGELWQQVLPGPAVRPPLPVVPTDGDSLAGALAAAAEEPFRLTNEPPLRASLFTLGRTDHVLLLVVHHIACDEWSMASLLRDLSQAYRARLGGEAPDWPTLPLQYADYAVWQREVLGGVDDPGSSAARLVEYWRTALAGIPEQLGLPFDHPRSVPPDSRHDVVDLHLDGDVHGALTAVVHEAGCTLFMALQSAIAVVLSRLGAGTDIPLGAATFGRADENLDDAVGFFANTVVLRTDVSGDPTFTELLRRVRGADLAAFGNDDMPFELLVEALNPERVAGVNPLFQVSVTMHTNGDPSIALPGLVVTPHGVVSGRATFDLSFVFTESAGPGMRCSIHYRSGLFDRGTVEGLAARLLRVLDAVIADPRVRTGRIDILSGEERRRVVAEWNDTARAVPDGTLPELFADQARRTPDAVAVAFRDVRLTYAELNSRANQLAHELVACGIGPEDVVALLLPRSEHVVVAILAVLKAGAAYMPLDTAYPAERIALMLADAEPGCVISSTEAAAMISTPDGSVLSLDDPAVAGSVGRRSEANPTDATRTRPLLPTHPAYVIYTSGSTGRPKGVVVPYAGVPNMVYSVIVRLGVDADSRVLQFATTSFDASVPEMWTALLSGGRLVVAPDEVRTAGPGLADFVRGNGITHLILSPSTILNTEFDEEMSRVTLVTAGEPCTEAVTEATSHFARVVNAYGPTEATVCATMHRLEQVGTAPPIGGPIANTRAFVLDATLSPVPAGVRGELYLAGAGLARGYLNRAALTSTRFVPNPFGHSGERMYRTGDIASWSADGALVLHGRVDGQVKLRGFRIEPGEVEDVLTAHPQLDQAVVIMREDRPGDAALVAYVVPVGTGDPGGAAMSSRTALDAPVLRRFVADRLPAYMVPSAVVVLDRLPLTPSGKLDRRALPAPGDGSPAARAAAKPARDRRTKVLGRLFAETLGRPTVADDESFFDLGGHSLLVVRLAGRVRALLGAEISVGTLFESPTPASLATRLDEVSTDQFASVIELQRGRDSARPVFCIHPIGGLAWCYSAILPYVDRGRSVYGIQATESHGRFRSVRSMRDLVDRYTTFVRSTHPEGPYAIVGWSLGGVLAYEVASQITASGGRVDLIAIFDSRPYDAPLPVDDLFAGVDTDVVQSGGGTGIDERQNSALIRAATTISGVLGPSTPNGYAGPAVCVSASRTIEHLGSPERAWKALMPQVELHTVEAEHDTMMTPEVMRQVGPIVRAALSKAGSRTPEGSHDDRRPRGA